MRIYMYMCVFRALYLDLSIYIYIFRALEADWWDISLRTIALDGIDLEDIFQRNTNFFYLMNLILLN